MQLTLDLFADLPSEPEQPAMSPAPSNPSSGDVAVLARELYDACPTCKPAWDSLGDITRGVWIERAERALAGDPAPWASPGPVRS